MPTQNVSLSEKQAKFIRESIKAGRFRNAGEAIRAGLGLLELQEKTDRDKIEALQRVAKEGFEQIDRGEFEHVELEGLDDFLDKIAGKTSLSAAN